MADYCMGVRNPTYCMDVRNPTLAVNTGGIPGKSAYDIAVQEEAFTGTLAEFAQMLTERGLPREEVITLIQQYGGSGGGLTEAEVIELIGEYGTVGDFAAADHTHEEYLTDLPTHSHEEYAPNTHSHSEYLTELPIHTHEEYLTDLPIHTHSEYLTAADLPAPVDLSEYPTRFEMQTAVQSVADPVIVLTEAEFAAIVPDATKIYVIY